MGSNIVASHPLAGGNVDGRHPEQGEGNKDIDKVEHERSPGQGNALQARNRINDLFAVSGKVINNA